MNGVNDIRRMIAPIAAYNNAFDEILGLSIRLLNGQGKGKDIWAEFQRCGRHGPGPTGGTWT